jgi:hypothetical protein
VLADGDEFRTLQIILTLLPITLNELDAPITVIDDRLPEVDSGSRGARDGSRHDETCGGSGKQSLTNISALLHIA